MHRSDKAVLRPAIGLRVAVLIAYGLSLITQTTKGAGDRLDAVQAMTAHSIRKGQDGYQAKCEDQVRNSYEFLLAAGNCFAPGYRRHNDVTSRRTRGRLHAQAIRRA